jgi:hypothetical protein
MTEHITSIARGVPSKGLLVVSFTETGMDLKRRTGVLRMGAGQISMIVICIEMAWCWNYD